MNPANRSDLRSTGTANTPILASLARLRAYSATEKPIAVLHLGEDALAAAWAMQGQAVHVSSVSLGLQTLADRYLSAECVSPLKVEQAIAEIEDTVMPWHKQLNDTVQLFTEDTVVAELAHWAGMPSDARSWLFTTEMVEALFNRWVARIQGRPFSQDPLPVAGKLAAALLVLREWLHHLRFEHITVLIHELPAAPPH